jgi:hypothetical protein
MPGAEFPPLAAAARLVGIPPSALARLAASGAIPSAEIPGDPKHKRVFREADLRELREKIKQGFEVPAPPHASRAPKRSKPLVSDEEKQRWGSRRYPTDKLNNVRALVRSYDLELKPMLAQEGGVTWLRQKPEGRKLLGPKLSPKKAQSLMQLVQEILRELRESRFYEVADVCQAARGLERRGSLLRIFLGVQEDRYGKGEVPKIPKIPDSPDEFIRLFEGQEDGHQDETLDP